MSSNLTDSILYYVNAYKNIHADLIEDLNDEIQMLITTKVANYTVVVNIYEDYIAMTGSVSDIADYNLKPYISLMMEDDLINNWSDTMEYTDDCQLIADEIVNHMDDRLTAQLIKDLNKFIRSIEQLKRVYDDSTINIGNILNEITSSYSE